jgi:hypothetical protein
MKKLFFLFYFTLSVVITNAQCNITYSLDSIPASCNGICDGGVIFSFSNGGSAAAPYNAIIKNSLGNIVDSYTFFGESGTHTFTDLCDGNYTVSIQGIFVTTCYYESPVTVTEPSAMSISSINVVHEVNGLNNGSITVNATGGTTPYSYSNNNGSSFQGSNLFNALTDGIYYVILQDANGCSDNEIVSVGLMNTSGCNITGSITPVPLSCASTCDGEILFDYENLILISPGAPYSVTLEDSDANLIDVQNFGTEIQSVTFSNLCSDIYTVTAQGSTCSFKISTLVDTPAPLGIFVDETDPVFGQINGSAELFATGGTPPFQYSTDGGTLFQLSSLFSNLDEGNYTAVIEDANGCTQQTDFTLTDVTICDLSIASSVAQQPTCFNACDGSINFNYTDIFENGPYHISLLQNGLVTQSTTFTGASGTGSFQNVCPGNYVVEIENYLGCIEQNSGSLIQPSSAEITSISTTNTSAGAATGSASVLVSGGQSPYTYSLDGTNFFTTSAFNGLSDSVHTVYILDDNGCSDQMSFYINEDGCDFGLNFSADSVSCPGMCDGVLAFDFNGNSTDTPYYLELFKDGNLTDASVYTSQPVNDYFTGICPGIYVLSVMNSSGCKQFALTEIEEPLPLTLYGETETATVYDNNGEITLYASGGNAPYQFSIDNQVNWQSNSLFENLFSDDYIAWVEDVNGCLAMTSLFVNDTATCTSVISLETTEISCPEDCDGTMTVIFNDTGNNPPYVINLYQGSYLVDTSIVYTTFSGLYEFTDLCEGAYQLHVVDEDGCADKQNVYINASGLLTVTETIVVEPTAGNSDGTVELITEGGTPPLSFTIDDGTNWQAENFFENLDNGTYTVMIEDANDCVFLNTFSVNEFPGCTINTTFTLTQGITCYDSCDAIISYGFSEAINTPPYTLDLIFNTVILDSEVIFTNSFSGIWDSLCIGNYSLSVTNGNGCKTEIPSIFIPRPEDLTLNLLVTDALPGQPNGLVDLLSSGGTGQHSYSLNSVDYQTQSDFSNLIPGNYLAYVMDENLCQDTASFTIAENTNCDITLSYLADDLMTCPGDCDGAISFEYDDPGINSAPYSVKLLDQSGSIIGTAIGSINNDIGIFTDLCAGDYQIMVEDLYGCQTAPQTISITQPDYLSVDQVLVHPFDGYYNGSITLNASGGTSPYEFSTNQISWSPSNTWTGLNAGFYILYVRDDNGCEQVICVVLENAWVTSVLENDSQFAAYPNPTQGLIFISEPNIQFVNVYSSAGSKVDLPFNHFHNGTSVDFSGMATGIYLVEFMNANGEIKRGKIVKN